MAVELLNANGIKPEDFAGHVYRLLRDGRRKFRNLFVIGEEGCGKSFLFDPLEELFKAMTTPASKYGWADAADSEVIYLNDFRYGPGNAGSDGTGLIEWDTLLRLLDGSSVKLKRPRNVYSSDVELKRTNTIPIFGNGSKFIESIAPSLEDRVREQTMMNARFIIIRLTHRVPQEQRVDCEPCPSCFSRLVLLGKE